MAFPINGYPSPPPMDSQGAGPSRPRHHHPQAPPPPPPPPSNYNGDGMDGVRFSGDALSSLSTGNASKQLQQLLQSILSGGGTF